MTRAGAQLDGGDQLTAGLDHAADQLRDLSEPAGAAVAYIAGAAGPAAPRKSGRLAAGVRSSVAAGVGWVYDPEPYAGVVHWGWRARNIRAQTFLVDTAQRTESQWITEYDDYLQQTIDTIGA